MYAKSLERILYTLCEHSDVSHSSLAEFAERFQSLRGSALLPRGRERREERLSNQQIVNAVFGLVPSRAGSAALGSIVLGDLRPVGGTGASFFGARTLNEAVQLLISNEDARKDFVRLTATVAEAGTNSNGAAVLRYDQNGERRTVFFVSKLVISLLAPGCEVGFDPDRHLTGAVAAREMAFSHEFFRRLAQECEKTTLFPSPPEGDGSEYDAEEAHQRRNRKLGVRPGSRYLNVGVDNQITWPKEESLVKFDRYTLVLLPKTKDYVQSVHMDLTANELDDRGARTVINRFLSVMAWCDDNFAIAQHGWSGNTEPHPVPKRDLAFATAYNYTFHRKLLVSEDALRALAFYREARNAQQNEFVSYAVLNFYKIIEIRYPQGGPVKEWFRVNFEALCRVSAADEDIKRFLVLCEETLPHNYIYKSCRIAVAHAGMLSKSDHKSDPDDADEIVRLHTAARVMHRLARRFIKDEFAVSDIMFSGT